MNTVVVENCRLQVFPVLLSLQLFFVNISGKVWKVTVVLVLITSLYIKQDLLNDILPVRKMILKFLIFISFEYFSEINCRNAV